MVATGETTSGVLRVGRHRVEVAAAEAAVIEYLHSDTATYAWPHYDLLDTGAGPDSLCDGDLLAPVLLNVPMTIRGFAGLKERRSEIESRLSDVASGVDLVDATDADIAAVGALFGVLDEAAIPDVSGTTFSKVLHRKRPLLVPLHDSKVRDAYVLGDGAPVTRASNRSWAEYMTLIASAMRDDLRLGGHTWTTLGGPRRPSALTPLRALDIIAWKPPQPFASTNTAPEADAVGTIGSSGQDR